MAAKSLAQWERLVGWLRVGGFLQSPNGTTACADYIYGPAGTLLRNNIRQSWWSKMVISQESAFPVEGHTLKDPFGFFHEVRDLMDQRLPFSLSQEMNIRREDVQEQHKDKILFNCKRQMHFKFVLFCLPSVGNQSFDQLVNTRLSWWKQYIGNPSIMQLTGIEGGDTLAGSSIQYQFPWGMETIETIQNKGDKVLKEQEEATGRSYQCRNGKKLVHPFQIECMSTLELAMAVFLLDAHTEKLTKGKKKVPREILQLHPGLAPFKASVLATGSKGREVSEVATYISRELRARGIKLLDTKDSTDTLEKNLIRNDKLGIPFTVIVNDNTLESGAISLRNRDTTVRETLAINKLQEYIQKHINS